MTLTLRVHTYMNESPPVAIIGHFGPAGGTLGRGPDCDLVLPDPEKRVSRTHARVQFEGGSYYLADIGSNASVLNGQAIVGGTMGKLANGDWIKIGEYLIQAAYQVDSGVESTFGAVSANRSAASGLLPSADPLGKPSLFDDGLGLEVPYGLREHDPLGLGEIGGVGLATDPLLPTMPASGALPFRGSESDHIPAHAQPFPAGGLTPPLVPIAPITPFASPPGGIPDDYDPLSDFLPDAPIASVPTPIPTGAFHSAPASAAPSAGSDPVAAALLRGLGIAAVDSPLAPEQLAELVGTMLRLSLTGTMDVLSSRAVTKREVRVERTSLGAQDNNPLKFLPEPHIALRQLLSGSSVGFMPPEQSVRNAFDDLKAHELAMLAGMRAAVTALLGEFDPKTIEASLGKQGAVGKLLSSGLKGKLWDQLVSRHQALSDQADTDFERIFGQAFAQAYDEQLDQIRSRY